MRDDEALLKSIIAHPDEDTPRLAYADWLDENAPDKLPSPAAGPSARAEFIRVQCRLATTTPDDPQYIELLDQRNDLATWLETHVPEKRELIGLKLDDSSYHDYVRGFPDRASQEYGEGDRRAVSKLCTAIEKTAATTTVRALRLYAFSARQMAELVGSPAVESLRALFLQPTSGEGDFVDLGEPAAAGWVPRVPADDAELIARALAESPHVKNLRDLRLFLRLTDPAAELLAGAKHLDNLTSFTAELGGATPNAIRSLTRADWFGNLRALRLRRLNDEMLAALAELPPFPNLHTLDISENWLGPPGLARLAASKTFPRLVSLDLSRMPLDAAGIAALGKGKQWRLAELNIRACNFGKAGAEALAASRLLSCVKVTDLAANSIGFRGVKALADCKHAASLRHLDLGLNYPLGKSGLLAIAKSPHLRNLTRLNLAEHMGYAPRYTAAELTRFIAALDMPNLRELTLDEQALGATGARAIAASPSFARLTRLYLSGDRISDGAFKAMLQSPYLQRLIDVNFANNRIGTSAEALANPTVWPLLARCNLYGNKIPREIAKKIVAARRGVGAETD